MSDCGEQGQYALCLQHFKSLSDKLDNYTEQLHKQNETRDAERKELFRVIYGHKDRRGILGRLDLHQFALLILAIVALGLETVKLFW